MTLTFSLIEIFCDVNLPMSEHVRKLLQVSSGLSAVTVALIVACSFIGVVVATLLGCRLWDIRARRNRAAVLQAGSCLEQQGVDKKRRFSTGEYGELTRVQTAKRQRRLSQEIEDKWMQVIKGAQSGADVQETVE